MSQPIESPYTDEQLSSDGVSKKDVISFLQDHACHQFLVDHKLKGAVKNVAKTKTKDLLISDYKELFDTKAFKADGDEATAAAAQASITAANEEKLAEQTRKLNLKPDDEPKEPPKYTKKVLRKGDKVNYPRKGDCVACYYTGKLADGTVFDANDVKSKKGKRPQPLKFKVGLGLVIRGWDEGIQTMSVGERAEFTIEPEWGYARKGVEGKVPPNATLIFEVELFHLD